MRTSFLIILGLTILVVASAAPTKKNERDVEKSSSKSKSPPAKKPSKKAVEEEDVISESSEDILKDDEDDEDDEDEIEIPGVDDLTTESDPIELGLRIKGLADRKKRKALINDLKKAENKYLGSRHRRQGKFYQDAAKVAEGRLNKKPKTSTQKATNPGRDIVNNTKAGLGKAIENARTIAEIGPLGIASRRGESLLLGSLSNGLKTLGKLSDFAHDGARNTSKLIRAATFPVDKVPVIGELKNNVHDYAEEVAERGKFLIGSATDNGSTAFATAARNADEKADEKEKSLLRQFSSSRKLGS